MWDSAVESRLASGRRWALAGLWELERARLSAWESGRRWELERARLLVQESGRRWESGRVRLLVQESGRRWGSGRVRLLVQESGRRWESGGCGCWFRSRDGGGNRGTFCAGEQAEYGENAYDENDFQMWNLPCSKMGQLGTAFPRCPQGRHKAHNLHRTTRG